jgi:peptidoglycan DL-endopeptidase CwlO
VTPLVAAGRSYRPSRSLLAVCTAAVTAVTVLPGSSEAVPAPTLDEVKRQVADLDHKAEIAAEQYNEHVEELRALEQRLSQYQANVQKQQAKVAALQKDMGVVAAAQYRSGGLDRTLQLLLSEDPERFLQQASSLNQLTEQQAESLQRIRVERQELAEDKLAASQQLAELEQTRKELAQRKQEVEGHLRKAQQLLNSLSAADRRRLEQAERASRDRDRAEVPPPPGEPGGSPPPSGRAQAAVDYAYAQLGDRYVWGATGPDRFDCSGLTMMAWRQAGRSLPHSSRAQFGSGRKVSKSSLRPGDLVFFYSPISHVGIYIGNGKMIHAPNSRDRVKVAPINQMPYTGAVRP